MRKSVSILLLLFVLDLFLVHFAYAATPSPTPSVSPSIAPGPNPGPPIGMPCGNTICLPGESCVQYPGDKDVHCVPAGSDNLTPTPTLLPPFTPTPTPAGMLNVPIPPVPDKCKDGTGVYPPNSSCYNDLKYTQQDPKNYELTCIYQPVVRYSDTREYTKGEQSFKKCGIGVGPNGEVGPGGRDPDCEVALLVNTDVKEAELGTYGPSAQAIDKLNEDFLSQNYLYSALFDRPSDLSDTNREAYRTYWRLMPAYNQANLRSFIMNMAVDKQIDNIYFEYIDSNKEKKKTDFISLYDHLKKQVILFWHFPFVRIGCLTQYPVCPEYALAIRELKPNFEDLRDLVRKLELGPLVEAPINAYESLISGPPFYSNLDGPYAAFVPLDFSSIRGYILKRKDTTEDAVYKKFDYFNLPHYKLTNISFENLPYVGAIYQGLLSPKFGMLPALEPSWIVEKYSTPSGLSDYKIGNTPETMPEIRIAKRNFLEIIKEETLAAIDSPFGWIKEKFLSFFTDEDKPKGYINSEDDDYRNTNRIEEIREVYTNPVNCPLPLSYHQFTPKTAPQSIDDHHQVIRIPGHHLEWSYAPQCGEACYLDPLTGVKTCGLSTACGIGTYYENGQCCKPMWNVGATKDGKALNVLNNPKQTDIRESVAAGAKYSIYDLLLPEGAIKIPFTQTDAQLAKHQFLQVAPISKSSKGEVLNPVEPVNRIGNQAQDSMHYLQSCWTVPQKLQNSPRCNLSFPQPDTASESAEFCPKVEDSAVNGKYLGAFKQNFIDLANRWTYDCPGPENNLAEECYNYVVTESQKAGVNPAFTLAIWLNESDASNYCHGGPTTQDIGVNLSEMYKNLVKQVEKFTVLAKIKWCEGTAGYDEPMHGWLSRFQSSRGVCDPNDKTATQYYIDVMNFTWNLVSGCVKNGKFGLTWPTDMSCP